MYITDLRAISPQKTYNNELLQGEKTDHNTIIFGVIEPNYLDFIPKGLLRRMGKAVRMGVGTGLDLVKNHDDIEGVIIGTANGGLEDCFKFLNQIVEYNEGVLTPTNFVQGTPNAIAGQLALMGKNRGYNTTYTNGGLAFENALLDALLLFEEKAANKLLIGGVEEISDYNYNIDWLSNKYKKEAVADQDLITSTTQGTVCGEGASMFVIEGGASDYYAQIVDVSQITYPKTEDLNECVLDMLRNNSLSIDDIDTVMLGLNGDIDHNIWYNHVSDNLFPNANTLSFKNLIGDYRTCTAFAVWLSAQILKGEEKLLPLVELRKLNNKGKKRILIYNHFDGTQHSFILLSK
jgi:3-oxoacyl-(acyl-carrier-protein) synthase